MAENEGLIKVVVVIVVFVVGLIVILVPMSFSSIEYYEVSAFIIFYYRCTRAQTKTKTFSSILHSHKALI